MFQLLHDNSVTAPLFGAIENVEENIPQKKKSMMRVVLHHSIIKKLIQVKWGTVIYYYSIS